MMQATPPSRVPPSHASPSKQRRGVIPHGASPALTAVPVVWTHADEDPRSAKFAHADLTSAFFNQIFCKVNIPGGKQRGQAQQAKRAELMQRLLPVLVPAVTEMCRVIAKQIDEQQLALMRGAEPKAIQFSPLNFLGQYLHRHNPRHCEKTQQHYQTAKIERIQQLLTNQLESGLLMIQQQRSSTGPFVQNYSIGKVIGAGSFATVHEAVRNRTCKKYAVKVFSNPSGASKPISDTQNEARIMKTLQHPHIVAFVDFFAEPSQHYMVLEILCGGELLDRIIEKQTYTEKEACDLTTSLVSTLCFMHQRKIVHRDLKPENILLKSRHDDTSIKLCDFGLAVDLTDHPRGLRTLCGTPGFIAPEIARGQAYREGVDVWAVGTIVYILLSGFSPFELDDDDDDDASEHPLSAAEAMRKVFTKVEFPRLFWGGVSDEATDFVTAMLTVDTTRRWRAEQLLKHPWIELNTHTATIARRSAHLDSTIAELLKFNARQKLRGAVDAITAARRLTASPPVPKNRRV
jgi:tRNA A-37 threonylcarbamoyl transferase component Bud32